MFRSWGLTISKTHKEKEKGKEIEEIFIGTDKIQSHDPMAAAPSGILPVELCEALKLCGLNASEAGSNRGEMLRQQLSETSLRFVNKFLDILNILNILDNTLLQYEIERLTSA